AAAGRLSCNPAAGDIAAAVGSASVSDNCDSGLVAAGTVGAEVSGAGCTFTTTKSWTVTDACGNTGVASHTVTYARDTAAPVITATGTTLTLCCNPTADVIDGALGTATATDNCSSVTPSFTDGDVVFASSCGRS